MYTIEVGTNAPPTLVIFRVTRDDGESIELTFTPSEAAAIRGGIDVSIGQVDDGR